MNVQATGNPMHVPPPPFHMCFRSRLASCSIALSASCLDQQTAKSGGLSPGQATESRVGGFLQYDGVPTLASHEAMGGAQARRKGPGWLARLTPPSLGASEATYQRLTDQAPARLGHQKGVGGWRATGAAGCLVRDTIYIPTGAVVAVVVVVAAAARPWGERPDASLYPPLPSRSQLANKQRQQSVLLVGTVGSKWLLHQVTPAANQRHRKTVHPRVSSWGASYSVSQPGGEKVQGGLEVRPVYDPRNLLF